MDKIGVIAFGHGDYLGKNLDLILDELGETLDSRGIISGKIQKIIISGHDVIPAARQLIQDDCDGVILLMATWVECPLLMTAIKELTGIPLILWGFTPVEIGGQNMSTGSYVSAAMFNGVVKRLNLPCRCLLGGFRDEGIISELKRFAAAAAAVKGLKYSSVGLIGYTSMAIYPGTFDHVLMRYIIGPEIEQMDSYTVIKRAEGLPHTEVEAALKKISDAGVFADSVNGDLLWKTASLYAALKEIAEEKQWKAVNVKCQYEFSKEFGAVPCLPLSLLADEGFVSSCEGDIPCTVTMLLLHYLSGETVTYGDALSHEGNTVKFSACGFLPFSMGQGKREMECFSHPGFTGIHTKFVMPPKRVTFARIVEDIGGYHLLYGTGQGKETALRDGCMPALDVELDGNMADFAREYAGQHYAICFGDKTGELEHYASLTGIKAVRI
jgi:L-fucose isomerase-like protein